MSEVERELIQLIENQENKLLTFGKRLVPNLTADDLLQPNDFPILEQHPAFRYEEGVVEGLRSALMVLRAFVQG